MNPTPSFPPSDEGTSQLEAQAPSPPRPKPPDRGSTPDASLDHPGLAGLSIVLPCFNEQANVREAAQQACEAAQLVTDRWEVIVVDDGSSDDTVAKVLPLVSRDSRVRLLSHPQNRGYGAAVRSGIDAATTPWVLLTDGDLQFDLSQVEDFLPLTDDRDLIYGWRVARQDPLMRRLNAAGWNWLVSRVFSLHINDVDCGFKLGRSSLMRALPLSSDGAMISTELLVQARAAGARIAQTGVRHRPRVAGSATGAKPSVVIRAFAELARLRWRLRGRTTPSRPTAARPAH